MLREIMAAAVLVVDVWQNIFTADFHLRHPYWNMMHVMPINCLRKYSKS